MSSGFALGIQGSILRSHTLGVDLRRVVLRVGQFDQGHEPLKVPVLALERDVELDHPVVYQLRGDDVTAATSSLVANLASAPSREYAVILDAITPVSHQP